MPGILLGIAVLGLLAWRSLAGGASPGSESSVSHAAIGAPDQPLASPAAVGRAVAPAGDTAPEAQQIKAQLLMAKARHSLGQSYERAAAHGDFALAPGRILDSLLDRRCGLVQRHAEELALERERLGLHSPDGAGLCREILFSLMKERLALPESMSQARFWDMLEQVDAAYARLVLSDPAAASDEAFRAAYERFREARRGIVGADLDRRLFGLADEVLHLPFQVEDLLRDKNTSTEQKIAAYDATLQRIEREQGVQLASVVEPLELAKHALRLHETAGPLGPEQRQAVLERYASPDVARRYVEYQQEQQDRSERLRAFNQERDQLLEQLARAGLTAEQRRQRMTEIDSQLFKKYHLQ